jgi:hypothetical protein
MHAVAGVMATQVPDQSTGRPGSSVEKIELSDDDREDD